jgi:hypothetical protein
MCSSQRSGTIYSECRDIVLARMGVTGAPNQTMRSAILNAGGCMMTESERLASKVMKEAKVARQQEAVLVS